MDFTEDTIGAHLYLAMYWYRWAALHYPTDPMRAAREEGSACGHAFRAAELAFDAGGARHDLAPASEPRRPLW